MKEQEVVLLEMAHGIRSSMLDLGLDPTDPTIVENFIHGCGIPQRLRKIIVEDLDEE